MKQITHLTTLSMARSGHNFVVQNALSWLEPPTLHHNLENIIPADLMPAHLSHGNKLLIYRDFDDWLASTIMKSYKKYPTEERNDIPEFVEKMANKYWAIMQEAVTPHYFKNRMVVHYDEFVESEEYRRMVCDFLEGEYNETMINFVPKNGGASSFDGKELDGKGSKMNVLNRNDDILKTDHKELYLNLLEKHDRHINL